MVTVYDGGDHIFDRYHINAAVEKALERRVWLKSGGFLVIDQTESCFVIDVNTGKYAGDINHGNSMLRLNLEASAEIAYQIRLRNMCGMIIIDFIGLKNIEDKELVFRTIRGELAKDRIPVNIHDTSVSGLFILTRKRIREPLSGVLQQTCARCGGSGRIKMERDMHE